MHRLIFPTLLSFVMVALVGCGSSETEPDANGNANGAANGDAGAALDANTQDRTTETGAKRYETPQAAYEAFVEAMNGNDGKRAAMLLSADSQSMMAAGMMLGASFSTGGEEDKEKSLKDLLERYGIDLDAEPAPGAEVGGPEALIEPIKDRPAFIGEIMSWMDENGDGDSGFPDMRELSEVSIEGETARGSVSTDRGPQPIEFQLVDGSWLVHLPMGGPPEEGDPGDFDPDSVPPGDDDQAADDGTPGLGTLWIGDKTYKLQQATAYRSELFGDPCTVVLLTARPISERQMSQLKKMLEEEGNDDAFFVRGPNVRLTLDESGELMSLFAWADNLSISSSGGDNLAVNVDISGDRISGTAKMSEPEEIGESTYRFVVKFDVELMATVD